MTLFGRDSLITSYQALPYRPALAATTLTTLADRQGARCDDFRDEEPGKILHEVRFGELTATGERPHSPYYGSADATPLFVILLDEYKRWTGDVELARALEPAARGALRLDRPLRGPRRRRLRRVPDPQPGLRPREPVLEGLVELDRVRPTAGSRAGRSPPARSRATSTTPSCGAPGSRARSGATRRSPSGSTRRRSRCASASRRLLAPERACFALALDGDKRRSTA
jgi:hypothetical protein